MALKPVTDNTIHLKSPHEVEIMREAGRIVARAVEELERAAQPGVTTKDLDRVAASTFAQYGATSTSLGYFGFPGHICVSVNEQVVHGIPGPRRLREGDLVKVDVAAMHRGYVADTAVSIGVGRVRPEVERLMEVTRAAMHKGIEQALAGQRIGRISNAIQRHVEANRLQVVREFVGHGVGRSMHEPPQVPHFGPPDQGPILRPGMCLAIEPQVNLGGRGVKILEDGWTAVTLDGRWSAHFEHTVAVTPIGPVILTLP